jgi:hypothetical protein
MDNKVIDHSKQAPAHVLAGKYGPGVYIAYKKAQELIDKNLESKEELA